MNRYLLHQKQSERGQSTTTVALSLGVLLLLIIGAIVLCVALFTITTMEDYDEGTGFLESLEAQSIDDSEFGSMNSESNRSQVTLLSTALCDSGDMYMK